MGNIKKVKPKILKLTGANMDIDLTTEEGKISWKQSPCPWNVAGNTKEHKCAVKNVSICDYFCGIKDPDTVLCSYPNKDN